MRLMLRIGLASTALVAAGLLTHAQSLPAPEHPAEARPILNDEGYSMDIPTRPTAPAVPVAEDDTYGY
jgi:hypothetical protein